MRTSRKKGTKSRASRLTRTRLLLLVGAIIAIVVIAVAYLLNRPTVTPTSSTIVFNFDTGLPVLTEAQSTPLTQTSNGLTVNFSSPSDPAAFSVKNLSNSSVNLSQFSGKYLYDNKPSRDILDIKFDTEIININITFATIESQSTTIILPSDIALTAYKDTVFVGQEQTYGSFSEDTYPQGTLSFRAARPFNWVRITVPTQTSGTTDFLVDNISVKLAYGSSTP